jgi:predicted transcriptional regulator
MFKEEILENERRREIYRLVEKNPGIHLRDLQRTMEMPLASLEYHLDYMVRRNVILRERDRHYVRYYVKQLDGEDKKILSALRQKRTREIVLIILLSKKAKYQTLLDELRIPPSTLSLYLKHLIDNNILVRNKVGHENIYTVQDEDRIAKTLIAYKSSFVDKLVDKALSTWLETRFQRSEEPETHED